MSMPAQNAGDAPVSTIDRTRFSRCRSPSACRNWATIARDSAFRRAARLSTIVPTAPVTFTSTMSLAMNIGRGTGSRSVCDRSTWQPEKFPPPKTVPTPSRARSDQADCMACRVAWRVAVLRRRNAGTGGCGARATSHPNSNAPFLNHDVPQSASPSRLRSRGPNPAPAVGTGSALDRRRWRDSIRPPHHEDMPVRRTRPTPKRSRGSTTISRNGRTTTGAVKKNARSKSEDHDLADESDDDLKNADAHDDDEQHDDDADCDFDSDSGSAESHIDDPIRMYLMQMGEIPMLSRDMEVASAKAIEQSRTPLRRTMLGNDFVLQGAVDLLEKGQRD